MLILSGSHTRSRVFSTLSPISSPSYLSPLCIDPPFSVILRLTIPHHPYPTNHPSSQKINRAAEPPNISLSHTMADVRPIRLKYATHPPSPPTLQHTNTPHNTTTRTLRVATHPALFLVPLTLVPLTLVPQHAPLVVMLFALQLAPQLASLVPSLVARSATRFARCVARSLRRNAESEW